MKFIKLLIVITALSVFVLACGKTDSVNTAISPAPANSPIATSTPPPDPFKEIRVFFSDKCASCHQDNGEGGLVKIEGKRLKVPALTKGHALGHSDEALAKQISNGGGGMPAFKEKLKPEEIDSLVTFIRKTFQGGGSATVNDARVDSLTATPSDTKKKMPMDMPKH